MNQQLAEQEPAF